MPFHVREICSFCRFVPLSQLQSIWLNHFCHCSSDSDHKNTQCSVDSSNRHWICSSARSNFSCSVGEDGRSIFCLDVQHCPYAEESQQIYITVFVRTELFLLESYSKLFYLSEIGETSAGCVSHFCSRNRDLFLFVFVSLCFTSTLNSKTWQGEHWPSQHHDDRVELPELLEQALLLLPPHLPDRSSQGSMQEVYKPLHSHQTFKGERSNVERLKKCQTLEVWQEE